GAHLRRAERDDHRFEPRPHAHLRLARNPPRLAGLAVPVHGAGAGRKAGATRRDQQGCFHHTPAPHRPETPTGVFEHSRVLDLLEINMIIPERARSRQPEHYAGMLLELMKLKEYWAYYYVSGGKWYAEELAEVRDLLCEHATQLFELDPNRAPPTSKALNLYSLSDIVAVLEHWDIDGGKFPLETDVGSCWWIGGLGELHFTLVGLAGIPKQFLPRLAYTSGVTLLAESMIALRYHLPKH